jgi:hypothetical protein
MSRIAYELQELPLVLHELSDSTPVREQLVRPPSGEMGWQNQVSSVEEFEQW